MTLTDMVTTGRAVRDVDLWAGVGALTWGVLAHAVRPFDEALHELVDARAAAAFGLIALARWYTRWSRV